MPTICCRRDIAAPPSLVRGVHLHSAQRPRRRTRRRTASDDMISAIMCAFKSQATPYYRAQDPSPRRPPGSAPAPRRPSASAAAAAAATIPSSRTSSAHHAGHPAAPPVNIARPRRHRVEHAAASASRMLVGAKLDAAGPARPNQPGLSSTGEGGLPVLSTIATRSSPDATRVPRTPACSFYRPSIGRASTTVEAGVGSTATTTRTTSPTVARTVRGHIRRAGARTAAEGTQQKRQLEPAKARQATRRIPGQRQHQRKQVPRRRRPPGVQGINLRLDEKAARGCPRRKASTTSASAGRTRDPSRADHADYHHRRSSAG